MRIRKRQSKCTLRFRYLMKIMGIEEVKLLVIDISIFYFTFRVYGIATRWAEILHLQAAVFLFLARLSGEGTVLFNNSYVLQTCKQVDLRFGVFACGYGSQACTVCKFKPGSRGPNISTSISIPKTRATASVTWIIPQFTPQQVIIGVLYVAITYFIENILRPIFVFRTIERGWIEDREHGRSRCEAY